MLRLELKQLDVMAVFTYSDLEEEIYIEQSDDFLFSNCGDVLYLKKSLYRLKQASYGRNKILHSTLLKVEFS